MSLISQLGVFVRTLGRETHYPSPRAQVERCMMFSPRATSQKSPVPACVRDSPSAEAVCDTVLISGKIFLRSFPSAREEDLDGKATWNLRSDEVLCRILPAALGSSVLDGLSATF